eukprot:Sdes_comp13019_c0_seq1m3040
MPFEMRIRSGCYQFQGFFQRHLLVDFFHILWLLFCIFQIRHCLLFVQITQSTVVFFFSIPFTQFDFFLHSKKNLSSSIFFIYIIPSQLDPSAPFSAPILCAYHSNSFTNASTLF